jgi:hypothetical protein
MRPHVLLTLLQKEALRWSSNRGGLAMTALLLVAALLLSLFGGGANPAAGFNRSLQVCYVDYWEDGELVSHLRDNVPAELRDRVRFREAAAAPTDPGGVLTYPPNAGAIQLRSSGDGAGRGLKVWFWGPGGGDAMAPYEAWFWKETLRFTQRSAADDVEALHSEFKTSVDPGSGMATALCLFGIFFVCVYLMPSLTCEERERGVLLAQALSPASTGEILAAKFLFYPAVGAALAAAAAGLYRPAVLGRPFFWLALLTAALGATSVGLCLASLARTQRAASLAAMCYLMGVALLLTVCMQNGVPGLPWLALEYHGPNLIHAALTDAVRTTHWLQLAASSGLALAWAAAAGVLFRRCGWQ